MTRMTWAKPSDRRFETGVDRGVLYPKNAPGVPWVGLTAVEENGGEGVSTYYLEGRPYLHFSKPKEYSATLSAHTYPNEFAPIMGLVEAADGMYLDSQMGDSFDLCYRTRVGDMLNGSDADYKIHLVYNATVVPPSLSYSSMGGEVNPVGFSWEIQAVPTPVEGYRPTAHVVIDSRNMDSERLAAIENLLYGTAEDVPMMPKPGVILDMLNFGGAVTVTDNGDGTFSVEGSYKNVRLIDDGVFQVDGIDAVNNGDGTFTINNVIAPEPPMDAPIDGGSTTSTSSMVVDGGSPTDETGTPVDGGLA